ncbi:MAG TPA: hypothetical protein VLI94_03190 [Solirubrobacterales bacterium]|nr:hypothetical protein [Solirubrobacterales bacterium]
MRIPHPKLNYANVIATLALFVALGGVAVAAGLPKNSVGQNQLKRGAVTAAKLKRGAVTSGKIAPRAVTAGKLGANAVLPGNLGNGIITTNKLSDGAVIASKIKNGVVTTNKLTNGAVTTAKLGDKSVTLGKLADNIAPLLGTLKSGQTLRGVFAIGGEDKITPASVSFQFPLLNPPAAPKENVLDVGKTNANCAGITGTSTPQANPGQLCVYITSKSAEFEGLEFIDGSTNRLGFGLSAGFKLADPANLVYGQWAVTAP